MHVETLTYEADGLNLKSTLYYEAASGQRPAVLVFPEALGLGPHAKAKAERLAGLGYVALACDYYGEGKLFTDMEEMMGTFGALSKAPDRVRVRAEASFKALAERPEVDAARIAAIGYCFGGTTALELARGGGNTMGTAGFHSGLATSRPQDAANIKGKVLVCIGADDPMIGPDVRDAFVKEMTDAKVDWQMDLYGGVVHSFTNPDAGMAGGDFARYDAKADARSWAALQDFLKEIFH